jgi:hypothetical protein
LRSQTFQHSAQRWRLYDVVQNPFQNKELAQQNAISWLHLSTLVAVAILVGTELVGAAWAAGWALGGLLQLDPIVSRIIEFGFTLCGFVLLYYFMRIAIKHEPFRR